MCFLFVLLYIVEFICQRFFSYGPMDSKTRDDEELWDMQNLWTGKKGGLLLTPEHTDVKMVYAGN